MKRTTVSHEDQVLQQEKPCPHTGKADPVYWILAWPEPAARIVVHCADRSNPPVEGRLYASRCHIWARQRRLGFCWCPGRLEWSCRARISRATVWSLQTPIWMLAKAAKLRFCGGIVIDIPGPTRCPSRSHCLWWSTCWRKSIFVESSEMVFSIVCGKLVLC